VSDELTREVERKRRLIVGGGPPRTTQIRLKHHTVTSG
jgi:hypothetical protein